MSSIVQKIVWKQCIIYLYQMLCFINILFLSFLVMIFYCDLKKNRIEPLYSIPSNVQLIQDFAQHNPVSTNSTFRPSLVAGWFSLICKFSNLIKYQLNLSLFIEILLFFFIMTPLSFYWKGRNTRKYF